MNITDYIVNYFSPLTLQSEVNEAEKVCWDFSTTHIPIIEKDKFIGCVSQDDIKSVENKNQKLVEFIDSLDYFCTDIFTSALELLKIFADNNSTIIPVIHKDRYIGYYRLSSVLSIFSSTTFFASNGFIIVLEKSNIKYSMSEVSQIVEYNNGVLLGCFISNKTNDKVELTLKISSQEINNIIQTFRRYNYLIITERTDDLYLEELKERLGYLQRYLST